MSQREAEALRSLSEVVQATSRELDSDSPWQETLDVLRGELADGQPFLFRIALASSSMSKSEAPVVSS